MNRFSPPQAVAWAVATLCALMASAHAQSTSAPDDHAPATSLPEVRITGTSLRRIDAETALPVIVLRRADIERSGARTATELLQQLPVMQGQVLTTSVVGTDSRGYASVSIHDLGDAYTLVLLNGQRMAPFGGQLSSGALSSIDINTIPLAMIERIEVLTDGASALYGADALGGVVNIITRRDGQADEATIGTTQPRGGAREWRASAFKSVGDMASTGQNLTLGMSAMHRDALRAKERDYADRALFPFSYRGQLYRYAEAHTGGSQYYTAPANAYDNAGGGNVVLTNTGSCPHGQDAYYFSSCLYNYAADIDLVPEQDQHSLMATWTHQIAPDSKLALDVLLSRSRVVSRLAPASAFLFIPDTSPLYSQYLTPMGVTDPVAGAYYRFADLGPRGFQDTSTLADVGLRLDGRHAGWDWQAGFKYSVSDQTSDISHALGSNAAQGLIDSGQLNPFLLPGQQPAPGMAALQRQAYNGEWLAGRSTLQAWQMQGARAVTTLPGGEMKWSLGADGRYERLNFRPSAFARGLLSDPAAGIYATAGDGDLRLGDSVALVPSSAYREVWGVFTELLAPVTPSLDLGAALRSDHDSISGDALTGKTHARWKLSPGVLWRASLGTGFKAPSLNQLRSPRQSNGSTSNMHDCTAALQALATQLGAAPCADNTSDLYPQVASGNDQLKPERSMQASMGMRLEPMAGHTLGVDVWAVQIRDRIASVSPDVAFENPGAFTDAWTTVPASGGGSTLAYLGQPLNFQSLLSSGVDIEAGVRRSSPWGFIDSQVRATAILREDAQNYPHGPWTSQIGDGRYGGATLKWRASWRTSLVRAGWSHSLTLRYQSGYQDEEVEVERLDQTGQATGEFDKIRLRVPGQVLWDWQTNWQLNGAWQLTVGVVNMFDTKPPLSLAQRAGLANKGQMVGYDERYFDPRGRMLTLEARMSF